ncbi:MAG: DUF839 domain-containing protein [Comamonadaceae bacterium]|nr:DUF839 domain-containing protein [Comamonadaceae bacterium]
MDRPEWLAIDPASGEVYCTLTNNSARGQPGQPGVDAANPRANNVMGQIIRWTRGRRLRRRRRSRWNHLVLAGDPANERAEAKGNIQRRHLRLPRRPGVRRARRAVDPDRRARHRRCTRASSQRIGNNQMLACDPTTGEVRRFLTGPVNCEITGVRLDARRAHDVRQHPAPGRDAERPQRPGRAGASYSHWPDCQPGGRPRSATGRHPHASTAASSAPEPRRAPSADDEAVAAGGLGLVERAVGALEQRAGVAVGRVCAGRSTGSRPARSA